MMIYQKNGCPPILVSLKKYNAVGLLVEANSSHELKEIRALAGGLRIEAISGESIAQQLSIHRYPVLISKHAIEQ